MDVEFMLRIKLPSLTDHADQVLAEARPDGFEYVYPRMGEHWPEDSEGFTFARLRCTDETKGLAYWMNRARALAVQLKSVKTAAQQLHEAIG